MPPGRKICDFWRPAGDRWVASTNLRKVAHDEKIKKIGVKKWPKKKRIY